MLASAVAQPIPSARYERALVRQGFTAIAGVDEVGRGCLAGPVVAAAVILPRSRFANADFATPRVDELARRRQSQTPSHGG